jgi:hypothetical protein
VHVADDVRAPVVYMAEDVAPHCVSRTLCAWSRRWHSSCRRWRGSTPPACMCPFSTIHSRRALGTEAKGR